MSHRNLLSAEGGGSRFLQNAHNRLHGITSQKSAHLILTPMRTSDFMIMTTIQWTHWWHTVCVATEIKNKLNRFTIQVNGQWWAIGWMVMVYFLAGARDFSLHSIQTGSRANPAYLMGTGGSFSGVKRLGCEADHSHLASRSKMGELYLHSPIHLHGMMLN
jgi:hypothetical protein